MSEHVQLAKPVATKPVIVAEPQDVLQRKATSPSLVPDIPPIVHDVLRSPGEPLNESTRTFMEPRFGHDFSRVRVHTGAQASAAASAVTADAYAVSGHLVFGAGQYSPSTLGGRQLIAHELTHVMQQGEGPTSSHLNLGDPASPLEQQAETVSNQIIAGHRPNTTSLRIGTDNSFGLVQRRVPGSVGLSSAVPTGAPGLGDARIGLARAISRTWGQLKSAQQAAVRTAVSGSGITWVTEDDLRTQLETATRIQLLDFAQAIRTAAPSTELGDPALINIGARPGTTDAANITTVVTNANNIFTTLAGTTRNTDIGQVFGTANVAAAKIKYANARTRLNALQASNHIVTDRSGYNTEVGLGGLSNSAQIMVEPSAIDDPNNNESVVTLIHESMHAGNSDVHDFGYIDQPSFIALSAAVKLTNAAHYEVVPRRILGAAFSFAGQSFIPAGSSVGGVAAPSLTPREQAIRDASETFRFAWTAGLNLHTLFVRLFRTPTEWNTIDLGTAFSGAAAGSHFSDTLPFWSKVEMLTMHTRLPKINPAGTSDVQPVTLIDIALSEGVTRKMSEGMGNVPQTSGVALAFEATYATSAELIAALASVAAERDLLIRLVLRVRLGSVTGDVPRDERVVARLAQASRGSNFTDYLQVRTPSMFP